MAARKAAVQEPKEEIPEQVTIPEPVVTAGGEVEVDLSEPGDDEEPEEPGLSRREKKQQRQTLREENERLRARELELERTNGEMLGFIRSAQQPQQREQPNPYVEERKRLRERQDALRFEFMHKKDTLTPKEREDMMQRGYDLEDDLRKLAVREELAAGQRQQPQQQNDPVVTILQAEYPEVFSDQRMLYSAVNEYQRLVLRGGKQPGLNTGREAIRAILEERGMATSRGEEQRDTQRRRYEGGATGGAGAGKPAKQRTMKLSAQQVKEAKAAFPHLPEAKALREYAIAIQEEA